MVTITKGGPWCPYHGQPMKAGENKLSICPTGCYWHLIDLTGSFVFQDLMETPEEC